MAGGEEGGVKSGHEDEDSKNRRIRIGRWRSSSVSASRAWRKG